MKPAAPLFQFRQGDHTCVFYDDDNVLVDFLVNYYEEGLRNGERCFSAQKPATNEKLYERLAQRGFTDERALDFHSADEIYFSTGAFAPVALMGLLKVAIADTVRDGFKGIRTAGEMSFAANGLCACDQLLEYEAMVAETFPGNPAVAICQYDVRSFQPEVLESVLVHHRKSLTERTRASRHSSLAIRKGRYVLDVVADRVNPQNQFYYVAQEQGKKEILGWGVETNFDLALQQGESLLDSLGAAHSL